MLRDTVRTTLNRLVDNDGRQLPPGQAKRWGDGVPSRHGSDTRPDIDLRLGNTLEDVFRTVNDQLRTVAHDLYRDSAGLSEYANRLAQQIEYAVENRSLPGASIERLVRDIASDVVMIGQLGKHFSRLEPTGGEPVRQAYQSVLEFLFGTRVGDDSDRLRFAADLLRDLQSGVFLFRERLDAPFPLTGRARVVAEMIEVMRTLDAIEAFADAMRMKGAISELSLLQRGGLSGRELLAVLEQLLSEKGPMLPGLAGRLEIPRLIAQLEGVLSGADGKPLLMIEGKPLRVGDLLWLNVLTNSSTLGVDMLGARLGLDMLSGRMPAPFLYGLDSIFSLIGFDGRSLSVPRFLAIQSQINAFDFDWVAGQAPLSEGWMRIVIESLKDSRIYDHNVLGEMLEEALTEGRFHLVVMRGTVENGQPVSGSFSFSPIYDLHGKVVAATQ